MPKEFFSIANCSSLADLPSNASVHFIGVAGVAMGQLAVALSEAGHQVSGSDIRFYEPMGSFLKDSPVSLLQGYQASNVPDDVDLVVIGNAISYGNEEVALVEEKNLPYSFLSKVLAEFLIADNHSVVVTGTHGKTTTTSILAQILDDPSYFIGGVVPGLSRSLQKGEGKVSVVEGDEYDSAFFAKTPKFHFYKAKTCIVNAIEFDHADIYENLTAIEDEFTQLIHSLPNDGTAICCTDFESVKKLLPQWKQKANCQFLTFGQNKDADYQIHQIVQNEGGQSFSLQQDGSEVSIQLPLRGSYNARNAAAAYLAALTCGKESGEVLNALSAIAPPKRRQEIRFQSNDYVLIEDFAHHPTAVAETLASFHQLYPNKKIIGIFEARSAASRRKIFQKDYRQAFSSANEAYLCAVSDNSYDSGHELLDVEQLCQDISSAGTPCQHFPSAEDILKTVSEKLEKGSVFIVMSNGDFGGLASKLSNYLKSIS